MTHWHYLAWAADFRFLKRCALLALGLIVLTLVACEPARAQSTAEAYPAAKEAKNASSRAEYACRRGQADKCLAELRATVNWSQQGVDILDPPHNHEPPAWKPLKVGDLKPIPSNFDLAQYLQPAPIPPSMAPDVVGAFRLMCNVSHLSYDDPIVYPGQPGKAHLHMFFGNTLTDASSDFESLRTSGGGTCQGDVLNRSAYWIPALLTEPAGGQVVVPDFIGLYYKRRPTTDPDCSRAPHRRCEGIPMGLRAIFGTNYAQGHQESPHVRFDCNTAFSTQKLAEVAARCQGAPHIYARIEAPDCWDGVNLDSEDHQSHLAYMFYDGTRATPRCPETHPVVIPKLSLIVAYAVLAGDTPGTWAFSSDVMAGAEPGTTFHADYMFAWDEVAIRTAEGNCLDKMLNCSGADFGNGTQGKAPAGFTFEQRPHWVPVPDPA